MNLEIFALLILLQQFWEWRNEWAISYRFDFMTRDNHTIMLRYWGTQRNSIWKCESVQSHPNVPVCDNNGSILHRLLDIAHSH